MKTKVLMMIIIGALITFSIKAQERKTLHSFIVQTIDGEDFDFSKLKGKKVLIVNTASKCGLTPQYKALETLYNKFKTKNFVVVGFPANNFANQEPGTNNEIKQFCSVNYGVSFPLMEKISVKGTDIHPLYKWLTNKDENGIMDSQVTWNFQKYLINEAGILINTLEPKESPLSDKIIEWLQEE